MPKIIDSHCHITWDSFTEDQGAVIERAYNNNVVQMIQAGVDMANLQEMIEITKKYEQIYFAPGLHPHEAKHWSNEVEKQISDAAKLDKCVAIGECGLDYFYNHSDKAEQQNAFKAQIKLAQEFNKPLIIHTRDAWEDTFAILIKEGKNLKGVFHCFTGSMDVLPKIKELDFYVSFSGIVTFKKATAIQEAAKVVPLDRLLVETDCPYLAPEPHRGKRNEPAYIWHTAQKMADLRQISLDDLSKVTVENTRRLFKLPE